MRLLILFCLILFIHSCATADLPDARKLLEAESFWDNRDFDWFAANCPAFECPDASLKTTYYYRWELLTKHLTYGSPVTGYVYTEFLDRPFWSGTYGAISCPAGLQLAEARWLADPAYSWDYARYWFRTRGAQPRRYSTWLASAILDLHKVHPNPETLADLLPELVANFEGWERERFDPGTGLFWQTGHDDGMEYNINSRQTGDLVRGAKGFRPTLNSYLAADAHAIAEIARLSGDSKLADRFQKKASDIRDEMIKQLWDPDRGFFFPRSRSAELSGNGDRVDAGTLTHQSGKHAGSPFGRELHGYVPWMFDLVPATGYDEAWSFLMKPDRFFARFGPTTVERQDPLFHISKTCCWWSGNSWPYATSQTLSALARTLQNPQRKPPIGPEDYSTLLASFARTHRRDGLPYLGEACDPDTGSWEGHDAPGHSDHYFHSSFCDLVISGLMGLRVDAPGLPSNEVLVAPLIPDTWSHAALHGASVRGRKLSILWDRSGDLYGLGKGLFVLVDGKTVGSAPTPRAHLRVTVEPADPMEPSARSMNFAVNNDGAPYPRLSSSAASSTAREPLWAINDGNIWYHSEPPNRWTTGASRSTRDWVDIDLGTPRDLVSIRVCLVDDGAKGPAQLPSDLDVEVEVEGTWRSLDAIDPETARPVGHRPTTVAFAPRPVRRFRIVLEHPPGVSVGMSEVEAWGPAVPKFESPSPPSHNLARDQGVRITASHTYRSDSTQAVADGVVQFRPAPANRWTSYESPSAEDWLEFDFGREFELNRAELAFFDDGAGVHAPDEYHLERWTGTGWASISGQVRSPGAPAGGQFNSVKFPTIRTSKLRLVSRHRPGVSSGLTEVELYRDAHP